MNNFPLELKRKLIGRLVFGYMLLFLCFRFILNATTSRLLGPPLKALNFDFTYWAFELLDMPGLFIYNQTGAILLDVLLFLFCILCILYPLRNIFAVLFGSLFLLYFLTYNTYIVHHTHQLTVFLLVSVPFFCRKHKRWNMLWEGMRYYICYLYVMSFVWKVFIGNSFFFWEQGVSSVKLNLIEYMYHFPSTTTTIYSYLISHPYLLNSGHIMIVLLEGIMVIGFFTRKYDRLLMIIPIIIHVVTYFASDVFFIEMIVGVFTFLSLKDIAAIYKNLSFLTAGKT